MGLFKIPKALMFIEVEGQTYDFTIDTEYDIHVKKTDVVDESKIIVHIYELEKKGLVSFLCNTNCSIRHEKSESGVYIVLTPNDSFKATLARFIEELEYPEKNLKDTAECEKEIASRGLIKYPIQQDRKISMSFEDKIFQFTSNLREQFNHEEIKDIFNNVECCITLDSETKIRAFLSSKPESMFREYDVFSYYWLKNFVTRIYIGSQFCPLKLPNPELLDELFCVCEQMNYKITINTPFITESNLQTLSEVLDKTNELKGKYGNNVDFVINDYGTLGLIKEQFEFELSLGVLLNRRQKDPRIKYRWGTDNANRLLVQNALNSQIPEIIDFLGVFNRFEYESNHIGNIYASNSNSLHFPFYQTNTSRFCPINAAIIQGDSNKQMDVNECRELCEKYFYLFSDDIPLIGIGNSLFGIYTDILKIADKLVENNINRIVYSFI